MRVNLKVPFAEKDEAKRLGAKWDAALKVWYIENAPDQSPFDKWLPASNVTSGGVTASKNAAATAPRTTGITTAGSKYVELPRVCDCPPWEVCDKCRSTALNK